MTAQRAEKAYEKYAWILLLAEGLIGLGLAIVIMLFGFEIGFFPYSPLLKAFTFLFISVIATTDYRRSDKWAWYALCYPPVYFTGEIVGELGNTQSPALSIIFLVPSVLGLVLPYRKFFPGKP